MITAQDRIRRGLQLDDQRPDRARGTILFVHGWPLSGRMFEYQMSELPALGLRCVSLDLTGFGRSAKPWAGLSFDTWADDVRAALDELDLDGVTLAGFSMGGAVAMHYMARHAGHRVARLALLAAAGPCLGLRPDNPGGVPREVHDGFVAAARSDRARLNADFGSSLFETQVSPEVRRWLWNMAMEASPRATIAGVEELRDRDLRGAARGITVPTLIVHGRQDRVIPFALGAELQAALITESRVVALDGVGHGLFYEAAGRVNSELASFAL